MYYSLHTTETAEHHTGDVNYGRTQKRQTWDEDRFVPIVREKNQMVIKSSHTVGRSGEKQSEKSKGFRGGGGDQSKRLYDSCMRDDVTSRSVSSQID